MSNKLRGVQDEFNINKNVGGLTGNHHFRGLYEKENFVMAWFMDFRFKIQRANRASPVGSQGICR